MNEPKRVIVFNCGSSSVKFQVVELLTSQAKEIAKGVIERIGLEEGIVTVAWGETKEAWKLPIPDHETGIRIALEKLLSSPGSNLKSLDELDAAGHRVVHGGTYFSQSVLITEDVIRKITELNPLAPLHNPANLQGIEAIRKLSPNLPQVAVFDTSFHQSLPQKAYIYGVPLEWSTKYGVRKYGFHGTSHAFVSKKACELSGIPIENSRIVSCHLGNGASVTAIKDGKSVDTSMGLTPLEGLVMGTRSGDIDPGVLFHMAKNHGYTLEQLEQTLCYQSGMKGIFGKSSDMRDLVEAAQSGDELATLALDRFAYQLKKYIGAFATLLNGLDLLILTGGIGENNVYVRSLILKDLEFLGVEIDPHVCEQAIGENRCISASGARTKTWVISTNEELVIAQETLQKIP